MDPRFPVSREDLYNLQMEVKQVQYAQSNHAERILKLEKRYADDCALKSVWNSPFPSVLAGTPQNGPISTPQNGMLDDLDEQGEQLLGSLHLSPVDDEPVRRGAASRANSVRFDESALHGSSWAAQGNRPAGDFGPIRPSNGLLMERSLSHKSDGRHSSAGHSVHSHHSVASGRASSLGLDTNFANGDDDDSSFDVPAPPVSLFVLGTVPSIVRCWLTTNYAHDTLLYADICTGSQKSTIDLGLVKELDLLDHVDRGMDGVCRVRLSVYLAEAVVTQHNTRSGAPTGSVPSMNVLFEVSASEQAKPGHKTIGIYIGSDALRAHSADVLMSQNKMVLYGSERDRLQVPFVRPEDDGVFRHICTVNMVPEKPKLNANATPFVFGDSSRTNSETKITVGSPHSLDKHDEAEREETSVNGGDEGHKAGTGSSELGVEEEKPSREDNESETGGKEGSVASEMSRRESLTSTPGGIWGSWRQGSGSMAEGAPLSGYQPASRPGRNMKVLRPLKSNSNSARTGASYEPPLPSKSLDGRRKSQASLGGESGGSANGVSRLEARRTTSSAGELRTVVGSGRDGRSSTALPRSVNPVGVASAFSWMTPPGKATKTSAGGGGD
ncbi:hypothetical protein CDD81_767 [Ophiocordyceps australis]|uniref:Ubiquitin carboxyl-terminal hydrolase 19 n=1 Tax=Ophiocordyceps australis TaxID=1399860 RepID=A0A2C5XV10_9HYPO|nr:hypothetical protein CDD81_767 [Ophiocordyceps australis]